MQTQITHRLQEGKNYIVMAYWDIRGIYEKRRATDFTKEKIVQNR